MANRLIARATWLTPLLAFAFTAPAGAQVELHGTENVPGRVYYHCRKYFGSETPAGGALEAYKHIGEDGRVLRMHVRWSNTLSDDPRFGGSYGIETLFGGRTEGSVILEWPESFGGSAPRLDWHNPDLRINHFGALEPFDRARNRKEPWQQVLVDRGDRLLMREFEDGQRYIYRIQDVVMASALRSAPANGFQVKLDDLAAWASGVDAVTVYETRVQYRRFRRNSSPNNHGPNRVVLAYRFTPGPLVETARQIRVAIEEWEASITDFKTECERSAEEDESLIVVT